MCNDDELFEKQLKSALANADLSPLPPLTPARMESLMALIPQQDKKIPSVTLAWRQLADKTHACLEIIKSFEATISQMPTPTFRDGNDTSLTTNLVTCRVKGGELKAQMLPLTDCSIRMLLTVNGACAERDDLSVELTAEEGLLEARPMEQKAEITLQKSGVYSIVLYAGQEAIGEMTLNVVDSEGLGHG